MLATDLSALLDRLPAAAYTCDAEGLITYFNEGAVALWGRRPKLRDAADRFCGSLRLYTLDGAHLPHERCWMALALADARPYLQREVVIERPDGRRWTAFAYASPIFGEGGALEGAVNILIDVTGRRAGEFERARLAAIVDSSDDAIASKDLDGVVQTWNAAAERLFGYTANEIIGRSITMIIPPERLNEEAEILARVRTGQPVQHFDTIRRRKDGSLVHVSLSISPIHDDSGRIVGASKIARDIGEREQAEKHIHGLLAQLREADQRKDEFLAMLAHELRGPMAPLRNVLNLVQGRTLEPETLARVQPILERQLTQMSRLVDDLLDVSRVTTGRIRLAKGRVDLNEVVASAVDAVRPDIERRLHDLQVWLPSEPAWIEGDSARLQQVLVNLLTNAAKYTEDGGRIRLTLSRIPGDEVVLRVQDSGVGIAPDLLPRIFDLFAQGERTLDRSQGGLGIGLSLVKRLVELHGGTVGVQSTLGRGCEFTIRLPVLPEGAAPAAAPRAPAPPAVSRRVLVVDDSADAAESLALVLRAARHEVRTAGDGPAALAAVDAFEPDVVLLDIGLPGMDGYEVARRLRRQPRAKRLVLIALTGYGQASDLSRSHAAGFDHHLVKPADLQRVQSILAGI